MQSHHNRTFPKNSVFCGLHVIHGDGSITRIESRINKMCESMTGWLKKYTTCDGEIEQVKKMFNEKSGMKGVGEH